MFEKLGHLVVRRRKSMVAFFIIGILTAGTVGSLVFSRLDSGGYSDPNSDSYRVYEYLHNTLKIADPNIVRAQTYADVIDIDDDQLPTADEVAGWTGEKFGNSLRRLQWHHQLELPARHAGFCVQRLEFQ